MGKEYAVINMPIGGGMVTLNGGERKRKVGRPTKDSMLPYKMLIIILYGRFKWVDRDPSGIVRVSIPMACYHMNIRRKRLYRTLEELDDWGLIDKWEGKLHVLRVQPVIPIGMAFTIAAKTIENNADMGSGVEHLLERRSLGKGKYDV